MMFRQVLAATVFSCLGLVFLSRPAAIQKWAIRSHAATRGLASRNPFMSWVERPGYRVIVRIIGVFAIGACALIVFAIFRH
jgi:hypothetical protein